MTQVTVDDDAIQVSILEEDHVWRAEIMSLDLAGFSYLRLHLVCCIMLFD